MKTTVTFFVLFLSLFCMPVLLHAAPTCTPNAGEVDSLNRNKVSPVEALTGAWELSEDNSVLSLSIPDSEVFNMPHELLTNLKQGFFLQDEAFSFPEDISELLGSHKPLEIKAGRYKVVHSRDKYIVTFNLTIK